MGVYVIGFSVSRPAGMGYTHAAAYILTLYGLLQVGHLTLGLVNDQIAVVIYKRHTCAVITAIFKARQSLEQYRTCLSFTDITYNSAHIITFNKG